MPIDTDYYIYPRNYRGKVEKHPVHENHLRFFNDFSSAGIELPNNTKDNTLIIHFRFKVFSSLFNRIFTSSNSNTIISLGHPGRAIKLIVQNGKIKLKAFCEVPMIIDCGNYNNDWTNIDIIRFMDEDEETNIKIRVNDVEYPAVKHPYEIFTAYFGESFYSTSMQEKLGNEFRIDLNSIRIKVE